MPSPPVRDATLAPALPVLLAGTALVVTTMLLGVAGCATTTAPASPAPHTASPTTGGNPAGHMAGMHMDGTALWAVQTGPLGVIVTDGAGHMLYRSDADSATPPTARCTAECATTWVPLRLTDGQPPDLEGVAAGKVGSVPRADGAPQVTLAGWPLYWRQGEATGLTTTGANGVGGWFVVTPTGERANHQ
jgi:predicted lipoprotein with Yx(FWY)xxD motif